MTFDVTWDGDILPLPPEPHYGADESWARELQEIRFIGPEPPPDEWRGFWEVTWKGDVLECPSLVEVVDFLSTKRPEIVLDSGEHPVQLRWRIEAL